MKLVEIYCPECDFAYDTPEVIPGTPPSCPKCGEVHTRFPDVEARLDGKPEIEEAISENKPPEPLEMEVWDKPGRDELQLAALKASGMIDSASETVVGPDGRRVTTVFVANGASAIEVMKRLLGHSNVHN